ncbi:MAG: GIY-YIG nuclease family protein [bacterium]
MDRRMIKQEYKQTPRPKGVIAIRNLVNGKILVLSSPNLDGGINRHRFQLEQGMHPNRQLQKDWNEYGAESFSFEILEELKLKEDPSHDYREDLEALEAKWLEHLQPYGERGYNKPPKA